MATDHAVDKAVMLEAIRHINTGVDVPRRCYYPTKSAVVDRLWPEASRKRRMAYYLAIDCLIESGAVVNRGTVTRSALEAVTTVEGD